MMEQDENGLILQRFDANCRTLRIAHEIKQDAIKKFHKLNVDGVLSNDADDWLCCAVYSELQKTKMKDMRQDFEIPKSADPEAWEKKARSNSWNVSLTEVLRIFKINIKKFLRRMEHWNWMAQNSQVFQQEITELDRRLGITLLLLKHYKRVFKELYVLPASSESQAHYNMMYDFGWLLFLVIRNELPPIATVNIINGCQVLVCAMELVYVNALEVLNSDIINTGFKGVPTKWGTSDFDPDRLIKYSAIDEILSELIPELPAKGVGIMKNAFFHKAVMGLFMDQRLLGNDRFMRELIKDGILEVNLSSLNRSYASHVADISEIDERVLLKYNTQSPADKQKDTNLAKETNTSLLDHLVDDTQRDNLTQLIWYDLPQTLPAYISKALGKNDSNLLQKSLQDMSLKFEEAAKMDPTGVDDRFKLISGLYYMLLDRITEAELRRRPTIKLGQMLMQLQSTFNATLIVCCLELVLHIFQTHEISLQFPWLLDCFGIDPFEFQKILELVVRHENGLLTRDLIQHLREVEAQCIMCLIWRKDSQLWRIYADTSLPSCQSIQLGLGQENFKMPMGSTVICLRKFYHLANQRLNNLCSGLYLLAKYTKIWHIVEHSIIVHGAELLQNRHVDQLILCAVYLYVRSASLRINFSDIIQQYRRNPSARSSVYRAVHLADGDPPEDIITFYNRLYLPRMADYARDIQCEPYSDSIRDTLNRPLQNISNNMRLKENVFLAPAATPSICMANKCKARIITQMATPVNLKRAHSNNELAESSSSKLPNILRRRTTLQ